MQTQTLLDCGHLPSDHSACTLGYGRDSEGKTYCYDCCANRERASMDETGSATLYLAVPADFGGFRKGIGHSRGFQSAANCIPERVSECTVSDWPGRLKYNAFVRKGTHNIAGTRYDAWFTDHAGRKWHGVCYGEFTQICHCRRLKD